jgi:predicted peptidase
MSGRLPRRRIRVPFQNLILLVDVFEAITAVRRRYNIDPTRILLRRFSMGGEGAWHIALHHPDRRTFSGYSTVPPYSPS